MGSGGDTWRVFSKSKTLPHPPSAQKERAVDGARIFVTHYYYFQDLTKVDCCLKVRP